MTEARAIRDSSKARAKNSKFCTLKARLTESLDTLIPIRPKP